MGAPTEGILQVLETLDCPPRLTFRLFNGPAHYYHLPLERAQPANLRVESTDFHNAASASYVPISWYA